MMAEAKGRFSPPWPLREPSGAVGWRIAGAGRAGERPDPAGNGGRRGPGWRRDNVRGWREFG